jgi:hypothetical protein
MRMRILVGVVLLIGSLAGRALATIGDGATPLRQWALVSFHEPTRIAGRVLLGTYVIVHDDMKMMRGEPCTTIYRFDPVHGPREAVVSFRCHPALRKPVAELTLTVQRLSPVDGRLRLVEYQFAGDAEAHGVPVAR